MDNHQSIISSANGMTYLMIDNSAKFNELVNENKQLLNKIAILENRLSDAEKYQKRHDELMAINEDLKRKNISLSEKIEFLKSENERLRKQIRELEHENKTINATLSNINERMKILENEKKERDNMMISAELITQFGKLIVKFVLGKFSDNVTIYKIISGDAKLNPEQQKRWDTYSKGVIAPEILLKFLKNFKDERNYESHNKYRDSNITVEQCRQAMIDFVKCRKDISKHSELIEFIDYVMNIFKKNGDYPFRLEDV